MSPRWITSLTLLWLAVSSLVAAQEASRPVNHEASAEARALLGVLYDIAGKHTLAGQHNFPNTGSRNSEFFARYLGKTPSIFSQDWGYAPEGDKDSFLARPAIVEEVKKQHRAGSIITLCWHAVPPTADEPVAFYPGRPGTTAPADGALASVQGRLTDEQFRDVLTPGTRLHERWCQQVDVIAEFLKQLGDANIPILWRPYHEMNGDWFWWGARTGEGGTAALYRQLFERLVKRHQLGNLLWVWSVDRPGDTATSFESVYPGDDYVDVLSLDVYGKDFNQSYYDDLVALAKGKPLILGEVGNPPTAEILDRQPRWTAYVIWASLVRATPRRQHDAILSQSRVLCRDDDAYWKAIAPLRRVAGLPETLEETTRLLHSGRPDLSGRWMINEDKSELGIMGPAFLPFMLKLAQKEDALAIERTFISEYEDDNVTKENLKFDGSESRSEQMGFPRVSTAGWSEDGAALVVRSTVVFDGGDGDSLRLASTERWTLEDAGRVLAIRQSSSSPWGEQIVTAIFERQ
ncbi:MAG: hypothetical protein JXO72_05045 [Vicinamibacteria bacterium]|nr:hypothetical protein [Vicinamibacteria bacterium]